MKKSKLYDGVFLVHGMMTGNRKHGVSWQKTSRSKLQYKQFTNWTKAKQFASKKTLLLKKKKYLVKNPNHPDEIYEVTARKPSKKKRKKR